MVFDITKVSVAGVMRSFIILGGMAGKEVIGPSYPLFGGTFIIAIPGTGYIKCIDIGTVTPGPGAFAVECSGSGTPWTYNDEGMAQINIDASGNYQMTGGASSISGKVYVLRRSLSSPAKPLFQYPFLNAKYQVIRENETASGKLSRPELQL
ncbi:hypothetical protein CVT25_008618 [Psilocybe cyanescens]|uniref:Uncharacterized protein n=1 Tax=Psilocybe cyanescens TaxID=93625 RepID=A0A409XDB8_PSICY|nr:hypothetical protein CVT25_008618 [Psilocybe cyanescens]